MVSVLSSYYEKFLATGEVKCIDEEIPFEIPQGWEWCRFGSLMINRDSERIPLSVAQRQTLKKVYDYYGASGVIDKVDKYLFDKDLLLIGEDGANLINRSTPIAFIAKGKYWVNNHAHVLDVCGGLNLAYIALFINAISLVNYVTGTAQPKMNQEKMNSILVTVPPISEQARIVNQIESLQPLIIRYDKAQSELNILNTSVKEQLKKSILQEAIQGHLVPQIVEEGTAEELLAEIRKEKELLVKEGKLKKSALNDSAIFKGDDNKYYEQIGTEIIDITDEIPFEIPKNWIWTRLKNFCSVCTGATFKKEEVESEHCGIRVLRGGNIKPFQLCTKPDDIFIHQSKVKEDILLKHNDIVTPAVTSLENIGKMAIVELDMPHTTVGGFVFIIRPLGGGESLSKYLLAFMSSPSAIDFMKSITNKSGQAFYNIGKERLVTALVPIPPLAEQERIVSKIEKLFEQLR